MNKRGQAIDHYATLPEPIADASYQTGEENGVQWAVSRAPIYGAYNGYVRIPKDHPGHQAALDGDYDHQDLDGVDKYAHGHLSYAEDGWVGFDTLHAGDQWPEMPHYCEDIRANSRTYGRECTCIHWTPEKVVEETKRLARRVAEQRRP